MKLIDFFNNKYAVFMAFFLLVIFTGDVYSKADSEVGFIGKSLIRIMRWKNDRFPVKSVKKEMDFQGRTRSYYVYEPSNWNKEDPIPLVFMFHGGGGNAKSTLYYYGLEDTAEKYGFLLVSPNGTGKYADDVLLTWNVFIGFGYAFESNVDDIGFIKELTEKILEEYPVDEGRIYGTGMSNGAFFCHFLASQPWNKLAAIAPVCGTIGGLHPYSGLKIVPPIPLSPVSVLNILGERDKSVPISGGVQKRSAVKKPLTLMSCQETIDFWVNADSCSEKALISEDEELMSRVIIHDGGISGSEVITYIIHNQGHAWPGSPEKTHFSADMPAQQFPANEIIWEFFSRHKSSNVEICIDKKR